MPKHDQITLTATPKFHEHCGKGDYSLVTAYVTECGCGRPVPCVPVKFTTNSKEGKYTHSTVETDENGVATAKFNYPYTDDKKDCEEEHLSFTASIPGDSVTILAADPNPDFRPVRILNATPVPGTNNYTINGGQISNGITAIIYLPGTEDQFIAELHWGTQAAALLINPTDLTKTFNITNAAAFTQGVVLSDGPHTIYYTIEDQLNNPTPSVSQIVTVSGSPLQGPTLLAPSLLPPTLYNLINVAALDEDISVSIPADQVLAGETATIFLRLLTLSGIQKETKNLGTVNGAAGPDPITLVLDNASLTDIQASRGDIYYQKTVGSQTFTSVSRRITVDTVSPSTFANEFDDDGYCCHKPSNPCEPDCGTKPPKPYGSGHGHKSSKRY
ncbi:Ig-like domain-containing protein [Yersinia sp. 2466 StPb PI]|uniref:Ig-like domain-containing protein n=1 Tax=Yersinia sp. 2466 StPb PI TaxID=3061648 RepID=UPI00355C59E4